MATTKQKEEIKWNIINSALAGALVLFGSFADGTVTWEGFCIALAASVVVAITKFKDYWLSSKPKRPNTKANLYFNFL